MQTNEKQAPVYAHTSVSLYVGDLHPEVTESALFQLFNSVVPVASIRVCRDLTSRASLGYAYVNFHSVADAERALTERNFTTIKDRQCRVMFAQRDRTLRESGKGNVFVKNLPENVDNKTLYDTFSTFGSILSCKVVTDRETGKSRGYGYVHYLHPDDATKAIEGVNNMLIADKQVHVELFMPRRERIKKAPWTNVYMKHIPAKMATEDLKKFVEEKTGGKVTSFHFWDKPMFGKSACFNFDAHESAQKCVDVLNNYEMKEWTDEKEERKTPKLYVSRGQKRNERDHYLKMMAGNPRRHVSAATNNLYVKPLGPGVNDEKLRELFASFGTIISAKVMKDAETGQSRGFGFVCFAQPEMATQAMVKLNGSSFDNVKLYVVRAQKKAERQQFLANRRRTNYRRMTDTAMAPPYYANPQMGGYYSYPRPTMPPQPQMYPAQYPHPQMGRQPYPFNPMGPMAQVPIPMPMTQMGMPMNASGPFGGFPGMRMPNPSFGGMQPNTGMPPQQQLSSAAVAAGATSSAAMRSGMGSVGVASQSGAGVGSARGAPQGLGSQGMRGVGAGVPATNYSQPTQPGAAAPANQPIFASAGQTGVEPTGPSRPIHSFPSQLSATEREQQPLTSQMLNNATAQERKRLIGERLFPKIQEVEPRLAGKITGMLLEMENTELLVLLSNKEQLRKKINEALSVLKEHHKKQSLRNSESQARQRPGSQGNLSASNRPTSANNQ